MPADRSPSPYMLLVIETYMLLVMEMCTLASLCSAVAPLFGNDPFTEGVNGLWVGLFVGLPIYLATLARRSHR